MYISSVSDIVSEHSGSEIKGAMEKVQTKTEQPLWAKSDAITKNS